VAWIRAGLYVPTLHGYSYPRIHRRVTRGHALFRQKELLDKRVFVRRVC
jgi:hypothetical protein